MTNEARARLPEYKPVRGRFSKHSADSAMADNGYEGPACVILPVEDWWPQDYFIPGERALVGEGDRVKVVEVHSLPIRSSFCGVEYYTEDGVYTASELRRPPATRP